MDVGKYIKSLRIDKGMTQEELGKLVGVKRAAVNKWENGMVQNLKRTTIKKLSEIFNVPGSSFIDSFKSQDEIIDNIYPIKLKKFPLLGEIACGEPIWAEEDHESFVMADCTIKADFCLKAKGESMVNARINDGDVVFIKKQPLVENGEIAAIIIDNEATLKRVYYDRDNQKLVLMPENPKFKPLVYVNEELDEIRILGKAIYFMSIVK